MHISYLISPMVHLLGRSVRAAEAEGIRLKAADEFALIDGRAPNAVRIALTGEAPDAAARPPGCRFHPRCPIARPRCAEEEPALAETEAGRRVACHFPGELAPGVSPSPRNFSPAGT